MGEGEAEVYNSREFINKREFHTFSPCCVEKSQKDTNSLLDYIIDLDFLLWHQCNWCLPNSEVIKAFITICLLERTRFKKTKIKTLLILNSRLIYEKHEQISLAEA